jgi:predicted nuclease of predicted toxin-antitoxin system
MKLLFDQTISFRIVSKLQSLFPECGQVRELNLENRTDREIWDFAKMKEYTIVTFDADFYDFVTLYGHPPKIIWLRMGNTKTENLTTVFQRHHEIIKAFIEDKNYAAIGCLEIE